jgi:uncharacterized membrane protein YphA (DoxX/SURF4 family)
MYRAMAQSGRIVLALGTIGMGVLGLVYAGLDAHWQRGLDAWPTAPLAYANGAILITASAALLVPRTVKYGGYALAAFLALWAMLNAPRVIAGEEAAWLAPAEILAVAFGAWIAAGAEKGLRLIRMLFGLCAVTFGVAHFLYLEFTASMIPAFIPFHLFFAGFTGAGHIAAGLSLISGILARLGSTLLALMFSLFVLLLHVPRVLADPANRIEWTMLCHATALTGAALLIASTLITQTRSGHATSPKS